MTTLITAAEETTKNPEKCQTCTPRDQNVPRFFDKHSWFRAPNETFSLVQSIQLSGKLSRLKNKRARKNVHASRLNANGGSTVVASDGWRWKRLWTLFGSLKSQRKE